MPNYMYFATRPIPGSFPVTVFGKIIFSDISHHITYRSRERGGVMVECWTLNKEVLGSIDIVDMAFMGLQDVSRTNQFLPGLFA